MFPFLRNKSNANSPKKSPQTQLNIEETILEGKNAIQTLLDRQSLIEAEIKLADEEAKLKAKSGDKNGAIASLRKKKLYQEELTRIGNSIAALETQHITLESARLQNTAFTALSKGVELQKQLQVNMPIEKIDNLIEDMQEQREFQNEINDAFNQIYDNSEFDQDYDELLALNKIDASLVDDNNVGTIIKFETLT